MASSINASTSGAGGVITTADNTGILNLQTGGTTAVTVDASQNVGIGTTSPTAKLDVSGQIRTTSAASESFYRAVNTSGSLYLGVDSSTGATFGAGNYSRVIYSSAAYPLVMFTNDIERMRIDSSGNVLVGTTVVPSSASTSGVSIVNNSGTSGRITFGKTASGTLDGALFYFGATYVGGITYSNTAVAYNTSSDYRLKENITPMTGALEKVALLNPVNWTWKSDGTDGQGFIAHELQAVVPDCVTGEKDAVDEEGNPKYQGVDTSFLVATLTAAIQELTERVKALEAK